MNQTGISVKKVKVNPDSSFVQTWYGLHPQCYIPSPKGIVIWFPEKTILKGLYLIWVWQPFDHVTIKICYKFTPLILWSLHMKFQFNWPSDF